MQQTYDKLGVVDYYYITRLRPDYMAIRDRGSGPRIVQIIIIIFSPLLDVGLSNFLPSRSSSVTCIQLLPAVLRKSSPGLRPSYTTFTETRSTL
jgi:hypothetical protein